MTTTLARPESETAVPQQLAVRFVAGIPGLEGYTRFSLTGIDDGAVYWLQSDDAPEIALPVADAFALVPEYSFDLSTSDAAALGLAHPADALVLAVLSVRQDTGAVTANLLAPVVINRTTWLAKQVILDGTRHSLRHPVAVIEDNRSDAMAA